MQRTSTTVGSGPERPDFFFLSDFLTLAMSAVQGPAAAKFGADESHKGLSPLPRVAGGGRPPDNGQDDHDRGQRPARKRCRPANTVCDPGNRLHILRLEERGPTVILVSNKFFLEQPPNGGFTWKQAISRDIRLCFVVFLRKLATTLINIHMKNSLKQVKSA